MDQIFPANIIEGIIERKYRPLIDAGADGTFLRFVDETKDSPIPPPNYGDILIDSANRDPQVRNLIDGLQKHGVREQDIRWWYNTHPLEQKCIAFLQDAMRLTMWFKQLEDGVPAAEATINVCKRFVRIGNPDDPNWGGDVRPMLTEADRPLPIELLGAMNEFLASHSSNDTTFLSRLSRSTSLNAFIREAIESGEFYQDSRETPHSKAEAFFISKIRQGLSYASEDLASEDKYLLLTRMEDIASLPNFSPLKYKHLESKCVAAIAEAYTRDTAHDSLDVAAAWRRNIDSLYKDSGLLISDIMQTWYLSVGRGQEIRAGERQKKQSVGCFSVIAFLGIGLIVSVAGTLLLAGVLLKP